MYSHRSERLRPCTVVRRPDQLNRRWKQAADGKFDAQTVSRPGGPGSLLGKERHSMSGISHVARPCDHDSSLCVHGYDTKTGDQIDRMTWSQLYSRRHVSNKLMAGMLTDEGPAAISAPQGLDYVAGFLGHCARMDAGSRYQDRWAAYAISGLDWLYSTVPPTSLASDVAKAEAAGQGHDSHTWSV